MQNILVFQQHGSGETKVAGIRKYGDGQFNLDIISIDEPLPTFIDDSAMLLPAQFHGDLVLDFLQHPDLSHDLSLRCQILKIPVVASGKKTRVEGTITPPT